MPAVVNILTRKLIWDVRTSGLKFPHLPFPATIEIIFKRHIKILVAQNNNSTKCEINANQFAFIINQQKN